MDNAGMIFSKPIQTHITSIFKRLKSFPFSTAILSAIVLISCATGPEFEHNNPYDRDADEDSLGINEFPPGTNKYKFTPNGISIRTGRFQRVYNVERRNGNGPFVNIGTHATLLGSNTFLDESINKASQIGFPLKYRFSIEGNPSETEIVEIDFGSIENYEYIETNSDISISWKDGVFLNEGFTLKHFKGGEYIHVKDFPPDSTFFNLAKSPDNLSSSYILSPYKYLEDEKTFLDSLFIYPTPAPVTNTNFEVLSPHQLKLTWNDNSYFEEGFKIYDEDKRLIDNIAPDQTEYILEFELQTNQEHTYYISTYYQERESELARLDFTIPSFPLPLITGVEHLGLEKLKVLFHDQVSFSRQISLKTPWNTYKVSNDLDEVVITTSSEQDADGFDISLSAELSAGKFNNSFPVRLKPSLESKLELELPVGIEKQLISVNQNSRYMVFADGTKLYSLDLADYNDPPNLIQTFSTNISFVRYSNKYGRIFIHLNSGESYILYLSTNEFISLSELNGLVINDAIFTMNDDNLLVSTDNGLLFTVLNSHDTTKVSVPDFSQNSTFRFFGHPDSKTLLALDGSQNNLFAFEYDSDFHLRGYQNLSVLNSDTNPEINNITHKSDLGNMITFKRDESVGFIIHESYCEGIFCESGVYITNNRLINNFNWNNYAALLDEQFKIISGEYSLNIYKPGNKLIHVIPRKQTEPKMLVNNDRYNLLIEFLIDSETPKLFLYDLNKKWGFTNYGQFYAPWEEE